MADTEVPFLVGCVDAGEPPLAGVSDYRGRPVYRETSGGWRSAVFVLAVEVASSFAFFGVSANLITYLTGPLGQSNAAAAAAVNAWVGTASLMPLLGAFIADSWLGRYLSIMLACSLYVLGYGMLAVASTLMALEGSSSQPSSLQVAFFYVSLYLVALAQGADSPCSLAFAADQFDPSHPREYAARSSFFNLWYFCFAAGITVAVGLVGYIQENLGWEIGFGMLCATVLCALGVFLLGTSAYRLYAPTSSAENPVTLLAQSLALLLRERCTSPSSFLDTKVVQYKLEDEAAIAKKEEARRNVLRLLSIWAACLSYGAVFAQVMTLFNKQGRTLDRHIIGSLELPPAALQMFGPATILLFVPFYDWALVPVLRYATGNPSGLTQLQRIGSGILLSLATMLTAALVEARRLKTARDHGLVDIAGATVPMSWVWLVPQYVTIGVAGVFAEVGMQEFFYDQMPDEMRSLGLALHFGVMGIGSFISGTLISVIDHVTKTGSGDSWFADNLNRGHLDYFYWVLAGLSAAQLLLYLYITGSYTYVNHKRSR
ncbi:hypothetical protein ACQ4PT_068097 [Festuca glaucescens]